ncbi:SDR family NAD(P)-dependent oxidoreductase [Methylophilus glucosoxydans]|jgi:short-subunit dehydrogenase|uniref:SDR family NAD(P)-dependent oxidoreductase n=1 Tax=Methylophilus glucosoxydans TaxID=752553 RepID=A0ABW3GLA3_9PROT|nr:SDR family oxidoreductase [Methylophilus sp. VKM B-3414]MDT7849698.1 SDR family oxidoreductase [Methylophilus sp. VKM B-3414]BEV08882.1 SDR family oxidoreductase [Methylophilus sp. DW102]
MNAVNKLGTALITGASTGIGAVYADRLAKRGYDLILVARDQAKLQKVADGIKSASGSQVEIMPADLTLKADLLKVETRLREDSSITLLVNNAGGGASTTLVESDMDAMETMIQLNITALTRLSGAAAKRFFAEGKGAIINVASVLAYIPEMFNGVYNATKSYVVMFSQSMQHELGDKGVRIQVVLPGATDTPFLDKVNMPASHLPPEMVMKTDDLVDAALRGFDLGEVITIPSLPNIEDWQAFDAARKALGPHLSLAKPANRYLS